MNIFSLLFIFCLTIQISSSSSFEFKPIRNNLKMNQNESKNHKIMKSILKTSTQLNKPVEILKIKNPKKNNKSTKQIQLQRGYTRILYSFG